MSRYSSGREDTQGRRSKTPRSLWPGGYVIMPIPRPGRHLDMLPQVKFPRQAAMLPQTDLLHRMVIPPEMDAYSNQKVLDRHPEARSF